MNKEEKLRKRLYDSEDRFTERKLKGVSTEDIRRTLIAFANSVQEGQEGILFIGISDKGEIRGVDNAAERQKDIRRIAQTKCFPSIAIQCEVIKESDMEIIAVTVPFSKNKPHFAGPSYVRVGSESVEATREMLEDLIASRNDKARYLLQYRDQGIIVLLAMRHPSYRGAYLPRIQCKVVECNPQYVTFREEPVGNIHSISIANVSIKWEGQMKMPLISEEWN